MALTGCSGDRLADVRLSSVHPVPGQDDRLVLVYVSAAEVKVPVEIEVEQDPQQVRICVRERLPDSDRSAIGHEHTAEVTLDAPLGDRSVVDAVTGLAVEVVR